MVSNSRYRRPFPFRISAGHPGVVEVLTTHELTEDHGGHLGILLEESDFKFWLISI